MPNIFEMSTTLKSRGGDRQILQVIARSGYGIIAAAAAAIRAVCSQSVVTMKPYRRQAIV
jgi:hypothetical protein